MDETIKFGGGGLSAKGQDDIGGNQQERPRDQQVVPKTVRSPRKLPKLPAYWTIGQWDRLNVAKAMKRPLSGYLGGKSGSGYWTTRLADEWCQAFDCWYAIPCNSATSGLLAACMAAEIGEGDTVWVSDYTMSASASCAMLLGANVRLIDIDPVYFNMGWVLEDPPRAIIVTNLFGHPADLIRIRQFCDEHDIIMIEDNAQAPFARIDGRYTGTIGHIGVFSLNVHKHIQSGEGGVIVTDDPQYPLEQVCLLKVRHLACIDLWNMTFAHREIAWHQVNPCRGRP